MINGDSWKIHGELVDDQWMITVGKTMPQAIHLGMVCTTHLGSDDWGDGL